MKLHVNAQWLRSRDDDFMGFRDTPEDEATLSEIRIEAGSTTLTEAVDSRTGELRGGANLSACRLAEWLTWNWWRLRWEPATRRNARDQGVGWRSAHELAGIGGGWLWPNVIVESDGFRVLLQTEPSTGSTTEPLRYVGGRGVVILASAWESAVDDFVERVLARLADCSLNATDLAGMWAELSAERDDAELAAYRRIEACLGFDVDQADPGAVERIIADSAVLGGAAMTEVAADRPMGVGEFRRIALDSGFDSNADAGACVLADSGYRVYNAAWHAGVEAARVLRQREGLGDGPIANRRLADLCAVDEGALSRSGCVAPMAFALHESAAAGRVVLRSKWRTGRRFEAARVLADRILVDDGEPLRPATAASTYRQKVQRAFAAEFLCPIHTLVDVLGDDFSDDARERASERFEVSPWAITAQLVNNRFLNQDELRDPDLEAA